ncbi:MAG: hypothetical protein EZS28_050110, partial [Streblomastix strix]
RTKVHYNDTCTECSLTTRDVRRDRKVSLSRTAADATGHRTVAYAKTSGQ